MLKLNPKQYRELMKLLKNNSYGDKKEFEEKAEKLKKQHGYRCRICDNKVPRHSRNYLHVHHLDRNKLNNKKENLLVVCAKCHKNVFHSGNGKNSALVRARSFIQGIHNKGKGKK